MEIDSPESRAFLYELFTITGGDTSAQASMYDVGNALGLEKNDAASMAENLFIQGLAELKTLSGGIGITLDGLQVLDVQPQPKPGDSAPDLSLGKEPVLKNEHKDAVDKILPEIKNAIANSGTEYPALEEMIIDIKTIEVQMLSPKIKTEIIREALQSIKEGFNGTGRDEIAAKLESLIRP